MANAKAICFDLDDTLWPAGPAIAAGEIALDHWITERCPRVSRRHDVASLRAHRQSLKVEFPSRKHDCGFLHLESLRRVLSEDGYPTELAEEGYAAFRDQRNRVQLFDDVLPALQRLAQNFRLFSVSNGDACLATIGIGHLFEYSIEPVEAGGYKPDPAPWRHVLARAALDANEVVHVGDDPHADVQGARDMGMHAVWIDRFQRPWPDALPRPASRVGCLNELCELLSP